MFCGQRSKHKNYDMSLLLNNTQLTQVTKIKYLGLYIDQHLTFDDHVTHMCGKISARTKFMWRIRPFIPKSLALTLYKSLIAPHFLYCSFILDGITESLKNKLQCHQNAALRAVLNVDKSFSTARMLTDLRIDSVRTEMKKSCCKMVYKGFYDIGPPALNYLFELYTPERMLRSSDELLVKVPKCNTAFGRHNIAYRGGMYWNTLPVVVKMNDRADKFKNALKQYPGFD